MDVGAAAQVLRKDRIRAERDFAGAQALVLVGGRDLHACTQRKCHRVLAVVIGELVLAAQPDIAEARLPSRIARHGAGEREIVIETEHLGMGGPDAVLDAHRAE